jgi:hypothetical protein
MRIADSCNICLLEQDAQTSESAPYEARLEFAPFMADNIPLHSFLASYYIPMAIEAVRQCHIVT